MRIARIRRTDGTSAFATARDDDRWFPLEGVTTTTEAIATEPPDESALSDRAGSIEEEPEFLCPIVSPTKVMAIGLNYLDHIRETDSKQPDRPILFAKFPSALNDPFGRVVMDPHLTEKGDYEVELAVVIGKKTRRASEEEALSAVFGYAVANDVSARDWQMADGQFDRSKSFDTFCPVGPWITTAEEVADPQGLALRSWVNGELRQDSSTKEMLFPVAYLIHYLSRGMTLEPGDVILTGTPHGVGFAMEPPRYLVPGDVVECEVEGLGRIRNEVVAPEQA